MSTVLAWCLPLQTSVQCDRVLAGTRCLCIQALLASQKWSDSYVGGERTDTVAEAKQIAEG